jgi:hypothetical protein
MGLQSQDFHRYSLSISSITSLVCQNPNDLDILTPELLQVLFRAQNKFEVDGFLE